MKQANKIMNSGFPFKVQKSKLIHHHQSIYYSLEIMAMSVAELKEELKDRGITSKTIKKEELQKLLKKEIFGKDEEEKEEGRKRKTSSQYVLLLLSLLLFFY